MHPLESKDVRYQRVVETLVTLLEGRNPFNVDHCRLVAHYTRLTARAGGVPPAAEERAGRAAEFHTVGLLLQMEEKRLDMSLPAARSDAGGMRDASMMAREEQILRGLLAGFDDLEPCLEIILQRHEWFDGTGSLHGHQGEDILVEARVLAVADAFVDMATPKSHRAPVTLVDVLQRLRDQAGSQFDPRFVEALASAVMDEEDRWGAAARARRFEASRCRHWLFLGHFYRQSGESQWAFRCYVAAQRLAEQIGDVDLEMACVTGMFMGYCDRGELERAREILSAARARVNEDQESARGALQLLWGLLECHQGRLEGGMQILEGLVAAFHARGDVVGIFSATTLVANVLLMHRGVNDPEHLHWLQRAMHLVASHDLLDVIIRYRPQSIPVLLSAVIHGCEAVEAQAILTRMGEPCHGSLLQKLANLPPTRWMETLSPQSVLPSAPQPATRPGPVLQASHPQAQETLQVACLGSLTLVMGERRLLEEDWPTQKAASLFALLVSRREAPVPCREIVDDLWPDRHEEYARSNLRHAVQQIRAALRKLDPPDGGARPDPEDRGVTIVRDRHDDTMTLRGNCNVDLDAFEAAMAEATLTLTLDRFQDTVQVLRSALSLYRGDFVENLRDGWCHSLRARLAEAHLQGLGMLARCYLSLGDPEAAELVARRVLSSDDLREEAHVRLIESLAAQGRLHEARRHFTSAVALLRSELGLSAPARLMAVGQELHLGK